MAERLQVPHPDGWAVHRGYSWPGLEKVSQAVGADNNKERAVELREVPGVKVSPVASSVPFCSEYQESYDIGSEENLTQTKQWMPEDTLLEFRAFMNRFYWGPRSWR